MPRILLVAQDKGGSGKTVLVRALAECLPSAHLIEIEANRRLVELEDRVSFFPVRAERGEINRTGGAAARAEFDGPLNAIAAAQGPVIVDVGANTAGSLLPLIGEAQARYARRGVEFGLLVVLTSEPGALANAPVLLDLAKPFTAARFAVENQIEGPVDPKALKAFKDVTLTRLEKLSLDERANDLLQKGGLRFIGEDLTAAEDSLTDRFGFAEAGRIVEDLTRFRAKAMQAAGPAARWLEG
ncbi:MULTISPECIES: hypothetical protein [Methylorubrum]|jgi:hypothetical protein|uniref:CobQ/CobB/MinD/ParA nucleotide binding domain-containing protein n=4 Tax=Methylorubrum TaxID=2282523 RepID=A0A160PKS9_9HYPH|nr:MULTISPECIES: hypothetical protein [Methylorubrum]MBK3406623.1 hypothetical protein [Methylorubrum rhodesianum]MBY0138837.1 hypothetical protein [Methylorubrum populi]BAU94219.1 hypothetical protein MPPM_5614 [Methylorubrum populi]